VSLVYGLQPVLEALRSGRKISRIQIARDAGGASAKLRDEAARRRVSIQGASKDEITRLCGHGKHQGVVAVLEDDEGREESSVEEMIALAKSQREEPLILLLDQIQDPQNLGALIRSAHALGAHGVVIPKDRAAQITPAVVRASAGAALHLGVARVTNLKHALTELKEAGVWTAAAVLDGDPADQSRLDGPLAVVIGSEGKGVRPSVAEHCDLRVTIPLARFDSLNASVAGGILLYEALRQRRRLT
jgi:23S rRNA (guanosine2251-2'-O)-methyltransferase